jgi:hypothetical protein
MFIKFLPSFLILSLIILPRLSFTQEVPEYDLECMSATNDWYVHLNVYNSQMEIFTTSVWNARKEYFKGDYTFVDSSTYRSKELNYNQHCFEINDVKSLMKLRYCMVNDDKFYNQDAKEDEKIQEMYAKGYEFGMGEIEFYKVPSPLSSGTLFYCFQKANPNYLHYYCK